MKWIRVDANFSRQVGIDILAESLSCEYASAVGYVVGLWAAAADLWEEGIIPGETQHAARAIAKAVGWPRDPGTLVRSFIAAGYLQTIATNNYRVVNWDTIGGKLLRDAKRKANERFVSKDSPRTVQGVSAECPDLSSSTTRHDTIQDDTSPLTSSCVASSSVFSARAREAGADAGQEGPGLDPPASDPETPKPDGASAEQPEELDAPAGSGGEQENPEPGVGPAWWMTAEQHFRARFGEQGPSDHDLAEMWKLLGDTRVIEADLAGAIRHHRLRDSLAPPIEDLAVWIVRQARQRMAERLAGRNGHRRIEHEPTPEEEAWRGRCQTALQALYGPVCPSDIERRKFDALLAAGPHEIEILEAIRIASERERCKPPHVPYIAKVAVELAAGRKERVAAREQAAHQAQTAQAASILAGGCP